MNKKRKRPRTQKYQMKDCIPEIIALNDLGISSHKEFRANVRAATLVYSTNPSRGGRVNGRP